MKTQSQSLLLCQLIIAMLILIGCASPIPIVQQQIDIMPSQTITPIISFTATPPVWATFLSPAPTVLADQELRMVELLQSKGCILPCYLGIIPGKTSLSEAKVILENIGANSIKDIARTDGATYHSYEIRVGDPSVINETPEADGSSVIIYHDIDLVTVDDTVEGIEVYIAATKSKAKFRQYWSRYLTQEIFLQMGAPDHLYANVGNPLYKEYGRDLLISYEKQNILIQYYGTGQEINICPENEARFINLSLSLYSPNSGLSIYYDGRVSPTNREVYLPIEEVLGVDTTEFYNQVLSNPSVCFKPQTIKP